MHDSQRLISDWWLVAMHPVAHKGIVCDHCLHGSSHTVYWRRGEEGGGGEGEEEEGKEEEEKERKEGEKEKEGWSFISSPSSPSLSPLVPLPHFNGLGLSYNPPVNRPVC